MKKFVKGRALYAEPNRVWIAKGMTFFAVDYTGKRVTRKYRVGSWKQRLLSCNRISRQLLREGLHHLLPLKNGDIFVTAKKRAYTVGADGKVKGVFEGYVGNKPGHQGVCVTPDGTIFFGEYSVNLDHKKETKLYRSVDNGISFEAVLTFPKTVRHIHFVKYDPFEKCLWLGTGDLDEECRLMRSDDNGDSWQTIGEGNQDWRAIGVCFEEKYLIWGTDAGSVPDQNHLVRMDRKTRKLEILADLEGPCHGCASFADGRVFLSTGVEGGENEKDRYARLKEVKGEEVVERVKKKKDILPLLVQYGVMRFPLGTENCKEVVFTQMGLRGGEKIHFRACPKYKDVKVLLLEGFARQIMPIMPALRKLGCHITTYNQSKLDLGYASRYPHKKILGFWDREDEGKSYAALLALLQKEKYDVVIPLTDFSATMLAKHKEELLAYTRPAVNDWEVFIKASDKLDTMLACMDNDVPCPHTLREANCVEDILKSNLQYPFVIKPRVGYGSIGFHVIRDEEGLKNTFEKAVAQHGGMVVQEYIPQTGIQYKCEVFIDGEGEVKSAVVFNKTRWYPVDGGSTCCSATVKRADIVESSVKLLKAIAWRGYADVDLIEDPRDNKVKVMEINPRITASVKICFAAGVDFARQIIEYETGQEVTEFLDYKEDRRLRYLHTDLLWFLKSPNRFKCKPSWFSWRRTVDQIWSIKDPWPWFTYTIQSFKKLKKESAKRKR